MRFGIFGAAQAGSSLPGAPMGQGFHDFIDFNVEAEALGYHGTFLVEHHFTGWNQVSATLTLLTWLAARTTTLRLGTAVMVLPWHNPVILAEQAATLDLLSDGRLDFGIARLIAATSSRASRSRSRRGCAFRGGARDHHQSMDLAAAILPSRPLLEIRGHRGRVADQAKNRTRRSGWPPAAPRPFAAWPSAAIICCSTSSRRST